MLGGETLLESSLQSSLGNSDAALGLLEPDGAVASELEGVRWFIRGSCRNARCEFDAAIDHYERAIRSPHFQKIGYAWHNLGIACCGKGDYERGITAFRRCLEDSNLNRRGDTWYNLGLALYHTGDYEGAIVAYRQALEEPDFSIPGRAWNNLGLAFAGKKNYEEAIIAHRRALEVPGYDAPDRARNNLATALYAAGRRQEAVEALQQVPKASRSQWIAELLAADLNKEALSNDDRALLESTTTRAEEGADGATTATVAEETPESRMLAKLEGQQTQYEIYLGRASSGRDNVLSILRGWSSAVTLCTDPLN